MDKITRQNDEETEKMKNILMIIPALDAGGAERVITTLANEWSKQYKIDILIFQNTEPFYRLDKKINLIKMNLALPKNGIKRLLLIPVIEMKRYKYLCRTVREGNYYFVMSFLNTTNILTCLLAKRIKNNFFVISERADPEKYSYVFRFFVNRLYKRSSLIICQNKIVKEYFLKHKFKNNLIVLPNPVNFDDIPTKKPGKRGHIISTVGRLTPQKNHKILISSFCEVHKRFPEYRLRIYGVGPLEDELKQYVDRLGVEEDVEFLGLEKRVMFEINKTEIFVLSSDYEGFPNVLIEAMATQMPVVSSDFPTGVARELITNGDNGYLFKVGSTDGLTDVLLSLIGNRDRYTEMGKKNKEIAIKFRDDIVARKWIDDIVKYRNLWENKNGGKTNEKR